MFAVIASWHGPKLTNSGRGAVIVVQHATQPLAPLDHACVSKMARCWADESVGQPLVIALGVIMGDEVVRGREHLAEAYRPLVQQARSPDPAVRQLALAAIPQNPPV